MKYLYSAWLLFSIVAMHITENGLVWFITPPPRPWRTAREAPLAWAPFMRILLCAFSRVRIHLQDYLPDPSLPSSSFLLIFDSFSTFFLSPIFREHLWSLLVLSFVVRDYIYLVLILTTCVLFFLSMFRSLEISVKKRCESFKLFLAEIRIFPSSGFPILELRDELTL
jgi:hypothetical protein